MSDNSKLLNTEDIRFLLEDLNNHLVNHGCDATLVIGGGAAIIAAHGSREATKDIDALFQPSQAVRDAASEVASQYDLNKDWLNDGLKGFVDPRNSGTVPLYKFGNLNVLRFDDETLLAMKLSAARIDDEKDRLDALCLMRAIGITAIDELYDLVERKTYANQRTPMVDYFIQDVFATYEREGGVDSIINEAKDVSESREEQSELKEPESKEEER